MKLLLTTTGSGESLIVIPRSAAWPTVVLMVALLLAGTDQPDFQRFVRLAKMVPAEQDGDDRGRGGGAIQEVANLTDDNVATDSDATLARTGTGDQDRRRQSVRDNHHRWPSRVRCSKTVAV